MQADLFAAVAAPPRPARVPDGPTDPARDPVAAFIALFRRYGSVTWHGQPCGRLDGDAWRAILTDVYLPLLRRWMALPIAQRPLPVPEGTVLDHLHRLDIFRIGLDAGAPVIPLNFVTAAAEAARRLRTQERAH